MMFSLGQLQEVRIHAISKEGDLRIDLGESYQARFQSVAIPSPSNDGASRGLIGNLDVGCRELVNEREIVDVLIYNRSR